MNTFMISGIGQRIKEIRLEKKLRISQVAQTAGVSNGLISKIENGRTIPSLQVLISIVSALDTDLSEFFKRLNEQPDEKIIIRKSGETEKIKKERDSVGFEYLGILSKSIGGSVFESVILVIEPGAKRKLLTTNAWTYKYMLKGSIEYNYDGEIFELNEGDSFLCDGRVAHAPFNKSGQEAVVLVIYLYGNKM